MRIVERLVTREPVSPRRRLTSLRVVLSVMDRRRGFLIAGQAIFPCALGRSGIVVAKREGDGGTPRASLPLRSVLYRAGRLPRPRTLLPVRAITARDAWCDDAKDRRYNRLIDRPPAKPKNGSSARTISTTSSSNSAGTMRPCSADAAARSSGIWRGRVSPPPPAASQSRAMSSPKCCRVWRRLA